MAGRIPQYFIDDLLARVNILDVVDGRVDKLKRAGKNYSGLCPFHKEKSPSFSVSPDKQFYYCFGCGAGGNAIGFLMEYDRLDFPVAVEELARLVGLEVPRENSSPQQVQREKHLKDLYGILDEAARYYEEQLLKHPQRRQAVDYLKGRGLTGQVAKAFGIGYAPPGWENLLQALGGDNARLEGLEQAGMLIRNEERQSLYDRFRERIMFPIRDMRGRVIAFGGRVLGDEKPKYLNSPETETFHKSRELYGLYEARQAHSQLKRLLIVEGYMDVVGLAQYGIRYAVATLGTATTAQHLERLFKLVSEVVFCFDGDAAGRKAASRALETTLPVIRDGQEARFLFLPEGEDPDSLVRREGADAFSARLDEALPLSEFFFRTLTEEADLNSLAGKARVANEALALVRTMQTGLLQQMMLERISEITGLSQSQINSVNNLQEVTHPATPAAAPQPAPRRARDVREPYAPPSRQGRRKRNLDIYETAISGILHFPQEAASLPGAEEFEGLHGHRHGQLLCRLVRYFQDTPGSSLGTLVVDWLDDEQLQELFLVLNEIAFESDLENPEGLRKNFHGAIQRLLHEHSPEHELKSLRGKSLQAMTDDEKQRLVELSRSGRS